MLILLWRVPLVSPQQALLWTSTSCSHKWNKEASYTVRAVQSRSMQLIYHILNGMVFVLSRVSIEETWKKPEGSFHLLLPPCVTSVRETSTLYHLWALCSWANFTSLSLTLWHSSNVKPSNNQSCRNYRVLTMLNTSHQELSCVSSFKFHNPGSTAHISWMQSCDPHDQGPL